MTPFKKAFLIAIPLTLMPLVLMLIAALITSGCDAPVTSTAKYPDNSEGLELYRWSTVKYDGHLYTCRSYGDSASMVHSPNCMCFKKNK